MIDAKVCLCVCCPWISCTALALHFEVYGLCCTFYVIIKYTHRYTYRLEAFNLGEVQLVARVNRDTSISRNLPSEKNKKMSPFLAVVVYCVRWH